MCLDLLCCCIGPAACGLCCCGGKVKNSVTTRLLYLAILAFVIILSSVMLAPSVSALLDKAPILCVPLDVSDAAGVSSYPFVPSVNISNVVNCSQFVGYLAVYRICLAVSSFFFLFFVVMLCVWSSKDPRSYLQNGFWCIKWLFVIGLIIAFFFIPDGQNFYFSRVTLGLGLTASIVFIVIQIILLVDFAHTWADCWIGRAEENDNKWWYISMLIISVFFYVLSFVGIVLLYVFFTELASCSLNKFFISSTFLISIAVSVIAILPWIQRAQPRSGLLQASIITTYATYVTWSAISTEPYGAVPGTNNTQFYDCQLGYSALAIYGLNTPSSLGASIVGIVILFLTVAYVCFSLSGNRQLQKLRGGKKDDNEGSALCCDCFPEEPEEAEVEENDDDPDNVMKLHHVDDEKERVTYSYSFFHFVMMLSVLYFMMQLTNWGNPGAANSEHFQNTWASTWVKMSSVWLCFAVYLWTLLAPLILGNYRDFGYE